MTTLKLTDGSEFSVALSYQEMRERLRDSNGFFDVSLPDGGRAMIHTAAIAAVLDDSHEQ